MNENNWQEQLIQIPLCEYEALLRERQELKISKEEKKLDDLKKEIEMLRVLYNG